MKCTDVQGKNTVHEVTEEDAKEGTWSRYGFVIPEHIGSCN